jgi:hypothetical protein
MRLARPAALAILGFAFLRSPVDAQPLQYRVSMVDEGTYYRLNNGTPFNSGNTVVPQPVWGNVGAVGLYLGAGAFSTSLGFTATSNDISVPHDEFAVRELAVDVSLGEALDLVAGKRILKWGTGYAFNPTGVVEPQRSPSDPSDRLSQNDGRNLISLTAFFGKTSITAVYLNDARYANSSLEWGRNEIALRAYSFLAGLDISLVGHYREGDRLELGANSSYVIGDDLELHGEILGKRGSSALFHQIIRSDNPAQIFDSYPYVPLYADSRQIFLKTLVGGQYTLTNGVNIALEYYHNAEGLSVQEWKRWMNFVKFQDGVQRGVVPVSPDLVVPSRMNLLWSLLTLSTRGTMRDYVFARGAYSDDIWGCEVILFMNVNDQSIVAIPTLTWKAASVLSLYLRYTAYAGRDGSEFGSLFTTRSMTLGLGVQL